MEVNAKVLFTFILGVSTLASGFVIRPFENIDYEEMDDIPGGEKSLDLEELKVSAIDQFLPDSPPAAVKIVTTTSHTTTPAVDDPEDCNCTPQFLINIYDPISKS